MVILEFQDPEGTICPTRITQIRHETAERGIVTFDRKIKR